LREKGANSFELAVRPQSGPLRSTALAIAKHAPGQAAGSLSQVSRAANTQAGEANSRSFPTLQHGLTLGLF